MLSLFLIPKGSLGELGDVGPPVNYSLMRLHSGCRTWNSCGQSEGGQKGENGDIGFLGPRGDSGRRPGRVTFRMTF